MTEQLAQQALLEKPKPKSIIVSRGATSYWGVDPSTRGVSIAWVAGADGSRGVLTEATSGEGLTRLHRSFTAGRTAAMRVLGEHRGWPGVVVVEQPSGQKVNNELVMAVGAIAAGLVSVLPGTRFVMVVPAWWKVRGCGKGNIYKPKKERGKPLDVEGYGVLQWARLNGYCGSSWDEADAMGMAEAARVEWALLER